MEKMQHKHFQFKKQVVHLGEDMMVITVMWGFYHLVQNAVLLYTVILIQCNHQRILYITL